MKIRGDLGKRAIQDVIREHPGIGTILSNYGISCSTCSVGICLLQDVVSIHALGAESEARIEAEIDALLAGDSPEAELSSQGEVSDRHGLTTAMTEEHRQIVRLISLLEQECNRLDAGRNSGETRLPDTIFFREAIRFIREFADRFHHAKEEDILFVELIRQGMPVEHSPVAAMRMEHEQGRFHVRGMEEALAQIEAGESRWTLELLRHARSYAALLREHISKEDSILYPLAERLLPESVQWEMQDTARRVEAESFCDLPLQFFQWLQEREEGR